MTVESKGKPVGKPNTKKTTPAKETATVETAPTVEQKSKSQLRWKERLALLPEDEAKALRAKAAEASRRSKAKKKGTTPAQSLVDRLIAQMARIEVKQQALNAERQDVGKQLEEAQIALTAGKETTDGTV